MRPVPYMANICHLSYLYIGSNIIFGHLNCCKNHKTCYHQAVHLSDRIFFLFWHWTSWVILFVCFWRCFSPRDLYWEDSCSCDSSSAKPKNRHGAWVWAPAVPLIIWALQEWAGASKSLGGWKGPERLLVPGCVQCRYSMWSVTYHTASFLHRTEKGGEINPNGTCLTLPIYLSFLF